MAKIVSSIIALILVIPAFNLAQTPKELITEIQSLMEEHYVFLDKAKEVNTHLEQLVADNHFDRFTSSKLLANALTEEMRKITNDKHLSVNPPRQAQTQQITESLPMRRFTRYYTKMLPKFEYLEDNIAYFDMRYFGGGEESIAQIDALMKQLKFADALIIDMRQNGGGSIRTVQYLSSYFFKEDFLLSSIYTRATNETEELWTVEVNGKRLLEVPIFILTSERTFSGGEDFSYTLQNHGRATVIGTPTRGGAHPTRSHNLTGGYRLRVPYARSIHPVTKSNWEGTGIIPNVPIEDDKALDKARTLASEAAIDYKNSYFNPLMTTLSAIKDQPSKTSEDQIFSILGKMSQADILNENDINRLGYHYLALKQFYGALAIFKANTQLFPNSPNVYNSYAEALAMDGQDSLAIINYKKAVTIAEKENHWNLKGFQEHLRNFEQK